MERPNNYHFFMHIPKTAGTSLRAILEARFRAERTIPSKSEMDSHWGGHYPPIPWLLQLPTERWESAQLLRGHYHYQLAERFPRPAVCLTMLREPVARSISALRHFSRHSRPFKGMSIAEILQSKGLVRHQIANLQVRMLAARYPLDPEKCPKNAGYHLKITKKEVELAKATLGSFRFFGIREQFEKSVEQLFAVFGWSGPRPLPLKNVATTTEGEVIDSQVVSALRECNRADIELYEFARELFWKRYRQFAAARTADAALADARD